MVRAYVKLILGKVDDNEIPLLSNDMQLSSVGRISTDDLVKDTRLDMYHQLEKTSTDDPVKYTRPDMYHQLEKMSMDFSMKIKTQVVYKICLYTFGKTIKYLTEASRSFMDQNSQLVPQSANPNLISLASKFGSMSDCME